MGLLQVFRRARVEVRQALGLAPVRPPRLSAHTPQDRLEPLSRVERNARVLRRFLSPEGASLAKLAAERLLRGLPNEERGALLRSLSVTNRAALVCALQRGATRAVHEALIAEVFLVTHGRDLTHLKNLVDGGMDHYDLQHLVYDDLDGGTTRSQVLEHIAREAQPLGRVGNKVLSDIDDTVKCWRDVRYPKGCIYPGARTFLRELARGGRETAPRSTDVGFLTARPGDVPFDPEERLLAQMKGEGFGKTFALMGDKFHFLFPSRLAKKKLENFAQYGPLYPEYGKVFVGDSGQGDILAGQGMLRDPSQGTVGVFIHAVDWGDGGPSAARRAELRAEGIVLFDDYAQAAQEAFRMGLLDQRGLDAVVEATRQELAALEQKG